MRLKVTKIGLEHAAYYSRTARQEAHARAVAGVGPAADYYLADSPIGAGVWLRSGGMGVAEGAEITPEQLRAFLSCHDPETGRQLGDKYTIGGHTPDARGIDRRRKNLSAYDWTISVPKSVSALWALASPEDRYEVEQAFLAAVDAAVDYMSRKAVVSRRGKGGAEVATASAGPTVARFIHTDSRAGDPQLHAHLLVVNRVLCDDGTWRTLDGRAVYPHAKAGGILAGAVLRAELTSRLGVVWNHIDHRCTADIAGMPDELLAFWSQRRRQVERAAADLEAQFEAEHAREPDPDERAELWDQAAIRTRKAKGDPTDEDPHERWMTEAADVIGDDADRIVDLLQAAPVPEADPYGPVELVISDPAAPTAALTPQVARQLLAQIEVSKNELTDSDLDAAAAAAITVDRELAARTTSITPEPADYVPTVAAALRRTLTDQLVGTPSRAAAAYRTHTWRSAGLMAAETAVGEWLKADTASPAGQPTAELDTEGLSDDQAAAAELAATATTNGCAIIGVAGAGKTTTLARVAEAVGHDNVLALAPTATAAATLGASIGTAAETVARAIVTSDDTDSPIPRGGLVIIDEASQLGDRDFAALAGHCARRGARVLLVGDAAQQGSVAAGGIFEEVTADRSIPTATLTQTWRFQDPAEGAATAALRVGRPEALDYHAERGRISDGPAAHAAAFAAAWWQPRAELDTLISAGSVEATVTINAEIAERRAQMGLTGEIVTRIGAQPLRERDLIITRRNNRRLAAGDRWVKNGERWMVLRSDRTGLVVCDPDNTSATVTLPHDYVARWVQLGYSITHTRAQSLTVDQALTLVTADTALPACYVGLTRGSAGNWLHVVTDQPGHDPDAPTEHLAPSAVLTAVLGRRRIGRTTADVTNSHAHDSPALHLDAVARTPRDTPLPVPEGFDPSLWLHAPTAAQDTSVAAQEQLWALEAEIQAEHAEWLDSLGYDPIAERIAEGLYDAGHHSEADEPGTDAQLPPDLDPDMILADDLGPDIAPLPLGSPSPHVDAWDGYEPPDLDPDMILADQLATVDHPDFADPAWDTYRDDQTADDAELADRPRPRRRTAAAEPPSRTGIDKDAVHDAIALTGLAGWIGTRFGVKVGKPSGNFTPVECPIHRPGHATSAGVYTDGGRHRLTCFAGCGTHDALGLVQQVEGLEFRDALRSVAEDFGVTATTELGPRRAPVPPLDLRPRIDASQLIEGAPDRDAQRVAELLARLDAPHTGPEAHPAWTAAVRTYLAATAAADQDAAAAAAALLAGLADPSSAQRITAAGHTADPRSGPARTQIIARRWAHHRDTITELTQLRRRHRPAGTDPEHDEHAWAVAVDRWLDDPAANPIAAAWTQPPEPDPHTPPSVDDIAALFDHAAAARPHTPTLPDVLMPEPRPAAAPIPIDVEPRPGTTTEGYQALNESAAWYRTQLEANTPDAARARRYLADRGITPEMCDQWGIGWAPASGRDLCDHLGDIDLAYDIGVAGRDTETGRHWDHLQGRITFELRDPAGQVVAFAGRTLRPETPRNPKYKNSRNNAYYAKSETLYGADRAAAGIANTGEAVIVEGYTDVLACHAAAITNTVAACGTAIGPAHLATLQGLGANGLTALFDGDRAGHEATNRLAQRAAEAHIGTRAARLPGGHDPADLTAAQLHDVLNDLEPALLVAIGAATAQHDPADARQTRQHLAELLDQVDLDDPVVAAVVRNQLITAIGPSWHRTVTARPATPAPDNTPARTARTPSIA